MRDDFGIGLRPENVAFALQLFFQRQIVFDNAVMHDHDVARAIAVRVGVFLGGTAMRRPAGVADAVVAIHRIDPQHVFEIAQFAGSAAHAQRLVVADRRRYRPSRSRDTPGASGHPE